MVSFVYFAYQQTKKSINGARGAPIILCFCLKFEAF